MDCDHADSTAPMIVNMIRDCDKIKWSTESKSREFKTKFW